MTKSNPPKGNRYFASVDEHFVVESTEHQPTEMRCRFKQNDRYGFIDEKGAEVIPPIYDQAGEFTQAGELYYSKVRLNGKEGLIDVDGNTIVPIIYDDLTGFMPINRSTTTQN